MMDRDQLGDLLARWAHWAIAGNRAGLGYAMVAYAERIGSSFSTDNSPPPVDTQVLKVDACIKRLPPDHRKVIVIHYTYPGTAKAKMAKEDLSRERYYELLDHGRAFIAHMLNAD